MRRIVGHLFPRQVTLTHRERLVSGCAAFVAIVAITWLSRGLVDGRAPFLLAPMGASAVLLLGAPHSPFSQPWSFVGGHLVSAVAGITCAQWIPDLPLAAGAAVGLAAVAMYYLRCLHPPGGATALLAVIGDERIHVLGYRLLASPLLVNLALLLTAALLINRLVPGRRYPVSLSLPGKDEPASPQRPPVKLNFSEDDLIAALRDMDAYIDVTGEDLERIYALATLHSHRRRLGDIRLADIMTRDPVTASPRCGLEELWETLRRHRIRGVPVVDDDGRVAGVVTVFDFMKTTDWRRGTGIVERALNALRRKPAPTVAAIMTQPAITAPPDMPMANAFLIFAERRFNHLPVVDDDGRPLGIVTRLDLLAAVYSDIGVPLAA